MNQASDSVTTTVEQTVSQVGDVGTDVGRDISGSVQNIWTQNKSAIVVIGVAIAMYYMWKKK